MFIIIVFRLGCDRPSGFFFRARSAFFPYSRLSSYLLHLFLCLISFLLFILRVFGKTLVHGFPISYCHTEWYLIFLLCESKETEPY